jgi:hypothetical protein
MTLITFQDGKVVFRDGAVGTEQACCCSTNVCCLPDGTCSSGLTQEQCENREILVCNLGQFTNCAGEFNCDPCPDGYAEVFPGYCVKTYEVDSCDDCGPFDVERDPEDPGAFIAPGLIIFESCGPVAAPGTWTPGPCEPNPCPCFCEAVFGLDYTLRVTFSSAYGLDCDTTTYDVEIDSVAVENGCLVTLTPDFDVDLCNPPPDSCGGATIYLKLVDEGCDCDTGAGCVLELLGYEERFCDGGIVNVELIAN